MTRFFVKKISCDKLKQITLANGQVIGGGARSRWIVTANEMLEGVNQQGQVNQMNGQIYNAKLKIVKNEIDKNEIDKNEIEKNEIYGVRDLTVKNPANAGEVDTEEYHHGDNHTASVTVSDEFSEVTFAILNPGGAVTLHMEFTLFSKFPIMHDMVAVEVGELEFSENYESQNNQPAVDSITITDDDRKATKSWRMKKNVGNHVKDIFGGETVPVYDIPHENAHGNAGRMHGDYKLKTGTEPSAIICDMIDMIEAGIITGNIKEDGQTFVIVSVSGKQFIVTVSDAETMQDLKRRVLDMDGTLDRQTLDSFGFKNQANGKRLNPEMCCKDISNGQKGRNYFVAPRKNIKWVSFEYFPVK